MYQYLYKIKYKKNAKNYIPIIKKQMANHAARADNAAVHITQIQRVNRGCNKLYIQRKHTTNSSTETLSYRIKVRQWLRQSTAVSQC